MLLGDTLTLILFLREKELSPRMKRPLRGADKAGESSCELTEAVPALPEDLSHPKGETGQDGSAVQGVIFG